MTRRPVHRPGSVSSSDRALWAKAMRDVIPLRSLAGDPDADAHPETSGPPPSGKNARTTGEVPPSPADGTTPAAPASRASRRVSAASPPITGLDRRTRQRLARGQADYEARLDLHGLGLEAARLALRNFLADSSANGRRLVLVITGKGESPFARHTLHGADHFHTPERQGRLRRKLPEWLAEDDLRGYVAGYQPAHPRHGGGGAFYVRLRRKDRLGKFR